MIFAHIPDEQARRIFECKLMWICHDAVIEWIEGPGSFEGATLVVAPPGDVIEAARRAGVPVIVHEDGQDTRGWHSTAIAAAARL